MSKEVYSSNNSPLNDHLPRVPSILSPSKKYPRRKDSKELRGYNGHKFLLPRLRQWRSSIPIRRSSSSSSSAASRESCSLPSPPSFSNTTPIPPSCIHHHVCNETIGRTKRPRYPLIGLLRFANGRDRTTIDGIHRHRPTTDTTVLESPAANPSHNLRG